MSQVRVMSHARKIAHTFALILALVFSVTAVRADLPVTTFEIVKRDVHKEITKTGVELIHNLAALTSDNPALRRKVSQDLIDAVRSLDGQAAALEEFVENMGNIRSADQLTRLASGNKLRAYAASLKETHLARFTQGDALLRTIVGQGEGAADQAGGNALNLMRWVEKEIADTGAISPQLDKRLAAALRQLPPDRARAARQLVRNKLVAKGSNLIDAFMRTGADSLFVLTDVVAISEMEDGAGKATAATETAIGFGLELAGNAAVRAVGGGFFLHGLIVSLSAAKVSQLASEIILLQYDLEDAAKREEWAATQLRIDAISGMLRVDALIKAGQYAKAQTLLTKVKHFYFNRPELAQGDDLYAKMQDLEQKANRAEQLMRANQVIAEARIPYLQGYQLAHQGRLLGQAHNLVVEAEKILRDSVGIYPELNVQLTQVRRLLAVIDRIRAKVPPLGKPTISGPDRVAAGEVATFEVALTGGTPDYQPVGISGIALPTGALLYWTAPQKAGMTTLTARLRDDNGSTVEVQKRIEVVTTETQQPIEDELRLWAYTVTSSYRQGGVTVPSKEVEAHDVHTGDDVHFQASIQNSDYKYRWSVNGKVETSPYASHVYTVRPDAEGIYRVVLSVTDSQGKALGTAEWTIHVSDLKPDYTQREPYKAVIPAADESPEPQWVLVNVIDYPNAEGFDLANKSKVYHTQASYSRGAYGAVVEYIGDSDTYTNPPWLHGESLTSKANWTVPPAVIKKDQVVSLNLVLSAVNNLSALQFSASTAAWLDQRRLETQDKKDNFDVSFGNKYATQSQTVTTVLGAGAEGQKKIIELTFYCGISMRTQYVYEWTATKMPISP